MDGKPSAIEVHHRLGDKIWASGQLEHRVRDTSSHAGKIEVGSLSCQISRSALVAKVTPEHQPTELYWSYLYEPAEILPAEDGTVVTYEAQRNLRLLVHPG